MKSLIMSKKQNSLNVVVYSEQARSQEFLGAGEVSANLGTHFW